MSVILPIQNDYLILFLGLPFLFSMITWLFFSFRKRTSWLIIITVFLCTAILSIFGFNYISSQNSSKNIEFLEIEFDYEDFKVHNNNGRLLCKQSDVTAVSWNAISMSGIKNPHLGVMIVDKEGDQCNVSIIEAGTR